MLWKRRGPTLFVGVLAEEARPGRVLRCNREKFERILERRGARDHLAAPGHRQAPQRGRGRTARRRARADESAAAEIAPGESATQTIDLPRVWDLSFQYASEVAPLEVRVGDDSFEMPPGIEGAIPFRPDEGPYWPVGTVDSAAAPSRSRSRRQSPRAAAGAGVDAPAAIGNVVATAYRTSSVSLIQEACYRYMDHYYLRRALQVSKESGGRSAAPTPTPLGPSPQALEALGQPPVGGDGRAQHHHPSHCRNCQQRQGQADAAPSSGPRASRTRRPG